VLRTELVKIESNTTRRGELLEAILRDQPELQGRFSISMCGRGAVSDGHTEKAGTLVVTMQPLDPTFNVSTGRYLSPFGILGGQCARTRETRLDLLSAGARPGPVLLLTAALLALSALGM
jgi:hypothetical protein